MLVCIHFNTPVSVFCWKQEEDDDAVGPVTPDLLDVALSQVIPAVKNTSEFVTIPEVTWADVGGLSETKTHLYNRFMVGRTCSLSGA